MLKIIGMMMMPAKMGIKGQTRLMKNKILILLRCASNNVNV